MFCSVGVPTPLTFFIADIDHSLRTFMLRYVTHHYYAMLLVHCFIRNISRHCYTVLVVGSYKAFVTPHYVIVFSSVFIAYASVRLCTLVIVKTPSPCGGCHTRRHFTTRILLYARLGNLLLLNAVSLLRLHFIRIE